MAHASVEKKVTIKVPNYVQREISEIFYGLEWVEEDTSNDTLIAEIFKAIHNNSTEISYADFKIEYFD